MRSSLVSLALALLASISMTRTAAAQAALDDEEDDSSEVPASTGGAEDEGNKTLIGAGLRIRQVFIPRGLIEIFVERANGGSSETGIGFEISRRKGDFEVQFGMEWDNIHVERGIWIDKGDTIPEDEPDLVEFDSKGYFSWGTFGWLTAEVSFLNHTEIAKQFSIRYGGGAGIAIMKGEVRRTDQQCDTADIESCHDYGGAENVNNPYDIPPVMLIVNAIIGVQIRPVDKMFINIEGGLRTAPFFGMTAGRYF
jgi:hypothetical protein